MIQTSNSCRNAVIAFLKTNNNTSSAMTPITGSNLSHGMKIDGAGRLTGGLEGLLDGLLMVFRFGTEGGRSGWFWNPLGRSENLVGSLEGAAGRSENPPGLSP